jgi:hypothetical protein
MGAVMILSDKDPGQLNADRGSTPHFFPSPDSPHSPQSIPDV